MNMAKFSFTIDIEPQDIPRLDDSHKRDVADVLTSIIERTFKRTLAISLGALAYFAAFSMFSLTFLMRMNELLPQINPLMPILCICVFIVEFVAGTMSKPALIIEIILSVALAFAAMLSWPTIWIAPFALYVTIINFKLLTLLPIHRAISAEPGHPEFTPLPGKKEIEESKNNISK